MIDLYCYTTPNPHKVSIMLEETGLPYEAHWLDPTQGGEQFKPWFTAINPNSKVPAIVDHDGPGGKPLTVFESGAILVYLAEKSRSPLLPVEPVARTRTFQWLFWQVSGIGPMIGQYFHFKVAAPERIEYATMRYEREMNRLLGVLDVALASRNFLAGNEYTIADIAVYPWYAQVPAALGVDVSPYAHVNGWRDLIASRPAVQRGMAVPAIPPQ